MDSFTLTLFFIAASAIIAGFIRRVRRDKCLSDFRKDPVSLELLSGQIKKGILSLESTGFELIYPKPDQNQNQNHEIEASYMFYKYEYPQIQAVIRYHHELGQEEKQARLKELQRTYHPNFFRRMRRNIQNVFKTIRDSLTEMLNLSLNYVQKKRLTGGKVLVSSDKYISKVDSELQESEGTAFEPMLEKYIGHKIVFELIKGDKKHKYSGVLKDYTASFIEIMDVNYASTPDQKPQIADLVVPQKFAIVRHLGENIEKKNLF